MVEFSRQHLKDGHFIVLWKDNTFTYSYFLWFEDQSVSDLIIKYFIVIYYGLLKSEAYTEKVFSKLK